MGESVGVQGRVAVVGGQADPVNTLEIIAMMYSECNVYNVEIKYYILNMCSDYYPHITTTTTTNLHYIESRRLGRGHSGIGCTGAPGGLGSGLHGGNHTSRELTVPMLGLSCGMVRISTSREGSSGN